MTFKKRIWQFFLASVVSNQEWNSYFWDKLFGFITKRS